MAAVTVTHHRPSPRSAPGCSHRRLAVVPARPAPSPATYAWRRALAVVLAVVVVAAVAVGTAGLGRMLDGQRGIPAAAIATSS